MSTSETVPPTTGHDTKRPEIRHGVLFVVAVCLSLATIAIWGSWNARQHLLQDKQAAVANLAQILSTQVEATIKQADTVLFELVERLEVDGLASAHLDRLQGLLVAQRDELAPIHGIFIYDEEGRWLANSNGTAPPGANNADREYFIFHRTHSDRGPHNRPLDTQPLHGRMDHHGLAPFQSSRWTFRRRGPGHPLPRSLSQAV